MPKKGKPFVMYRRSPGNFTIVPRGVAGWFQFAVWLALLGALVVWFDNHVEAHPHGANFHFGLILFGMGVLGWIIACLWWIVARAEVIDVGIMLRDRQMAERKRRRGQ